MPTMADITVKKNDGTTDIVYVAKSPSAGDSVPAVWRSDAAPAAYAGLKPEFRMLTKWNGDRTVRRADCVGVYTSTAVNTTTTITEAIGRIVMNASFAIPQNVPQADIDEAISQLTNIMVSALVRSSLKSGFAAT